MSDRLVTTIEQRRSGARVIKFAGVLDEHNRLAELLEKVGSGVTLINLSGVERVNSSGTRDWVNWLERLHAKGIKPVLIACSPAVVAQLNTIKDFAGRAIVKSFQVPYHCEPCGIDKLLLVHVADLGAPPHTAPSCTCDACGGVMTFTDESGTYFEFVAEAQNAQRATKKDTKQEAQEASDEPERDLARGSRSSITSQHVAKVSKPRVLLRDSRPSMSVFQVVNTRPSEYELTGPRPRQMVNDRPYLIAIVILVLLCTLAALAAIFVLT